MANKIFEATVQSLSSYSEIYTENSFSIIERIHHLLKQKNMTQKDLAQKLNKTESEISKILSPGHNMTLKTISKIEDALDEKIIVIPKSVQTKSPEELAASTTKVKA